MPYNLNNTEQKDKVTERNFDVLINGKTVIENLGDDNYLQPVRAFSTRVTVYVIDGKGIDVKLKSIKGEPILNGIQVQRVF